ncbi:MAG: guanylate kinase [Rikenellaceae bacterium]|nr:guanylate kinase [Rikenellaceae bacterium]MCL2692461.1 guanylate kinase [Rikenellaceae bacterium]
MKDIYIMNQGKLIILSAPSGAGKTTVMRRIVETFPQLEFSVSATSRPPRGTEQNGVEYYFVTERQFLDDVAAGKFIEWEEVYGGTHYGTLRSEVERIWVSGRVIIFDVDVKGGVKLKSIFGRSALSIFIMPPSVATLRERLTGRGTDSPEAIERRVAKAEQEMRYAPQFDLTVVNDDLDVAVACIEEAIRRFLEI